MTQQLSKFLLRFQFWLAWKDFSHAYRQWFALGGPRVFLHSNWHATEICMPCKHILRFRDLPTSVARSLGSNKKLIPSMPRVPKSPACRSCQIFRHAGHTKLSHIAGMPNSLACRACQNLRHAGHAKIRVWRVLNAKVSSLNLQIFKPG